MPKRKRRSYTREQKADAVRMVREVGNLCQVARDLELTQSRASSKRAALASRLLVALRCLLISLVHYDCYRLILLERRNFLCIQMCLNINNLPVAEVLKPRPEEREQLPAF